ncbi:hypothetical protein V6N13_145907 [Hibiscus sabdariffa]|uniref:Uncharacterized protein n=1 Tax=Hibiscus sabdariffa TaxID=183260 RepID=A0ABR2TR19_9ROSI
MPYLVVAYIPALSPAILQMYMGLACLAGLNMATHHGEAALFAFNGIVGQGQGKWCGRRACRMWVSPDLIVSAACIFNARFQDSTIYICTLIQKRPQFKQRKREAPAEET